MFEVFLNTPVLNLRTLFQKNPFLVVAIMVTNAKSKRWYFYDGTTSQGNVLENIMSQFGLQQTIKEPTRILDNSSSCSDLIFASKPSLITETGVHRLYIQTFMIR